MAVGSSYLLPLSIKPAISKFGKTGVTRRSELEVKINALGFLTILRLLGYDMESCRVLLCEWVCFSFLSPHFPCFLFSFSIIATPLSLPPPLPFFRVRDMTIGTGVLANYSSNSPPVLSPRPPSSSFLWRCPVRDLQNEVIMK